MTRIATLKSFFLLSLLMIAGAVTALAASHTVTFHVNGKIVSTAEVEEGASIPFPAVVVPTGYAHLGWTRAEISSEQASAPTDLVNSAAMGSTNINCYAVFAKVTEGTEEKTDVLDLSFTGITNNNSYSNWYDKTGYSGAVYVGRSAGGNSSIQMNKDSYAGFFSTASAGKVKKVKVVWNEYTENGRTLYIFGKNTAYSTQYVGNSHSDLYQGAKRGKYLGSIVCGTSTELTINGDYSYIGIRPYSESGALYLTSISIVWVNVEYSDYCTSIPPLTTTITDAGWATYAPAYPVSFRTGTSAYIVKAIVKEDNLIDYTQVALEKVTSVPAGKPVLLKGTAGVVTEVKMDVTSSETDDVTGNCLCVSTGTNLSTNMYVLANVDGVVGFYLWDKTNGGDLPAGKIFLSLADAQQGGVGARPFIALPGEEAAISDVNREATTNNRYFDLHGRRVLQPTKGLYIVNGKLVMIK